MYTDQAIIKSKLETDLLSKFGESVRQDAFSLIDRLANKDTFVDKYLLLNLQNILSLSKAQARYFIKLALELSLSSAFAPVLLLEKIPTLSFYGVIEEIGTFLSNIKHYGGRSIALFLGSDQLKTDDLLDILEKSNIDFYKALLNAVNNRHRDFGVCSASIMRASAQLQTVLNVDGIQPYLDLCTILINRYGLKITDQYIKNSHQLIARIPLKNNLGIIEKWADKSLIAAEFSVTYPSIVFSFSKEAENKIIDIQSDADSIKLLKLRLLTTEDYETILANPWLLTDLDFSTLVLVWPNLSETIKKNILFQLAKQNYKDYINDHFPIQAERDEVNLVTDSKWLKPWTFCSEVIDLPYIRKRIASILQIKNNFSLDAKCIIKSNRDIFDRSNFIYDSSRIAKMINILLKHSIDTNTRDELIAFSDFLSEKRDSLKNLLSHSNLVIQTWDRDPWMDYGRSDQLYSCTSLGDYNAANAPGFLADLNINNLDIWANSEKIGRIHLCLVKDAKDHPLLLLDCVDGTERMIASQKKYKLILSAVMAYARFLGINTIKVNYDIDYNTTPKKFIAHIEKDFHQTDRIDFVTRFLSISTTKYLIPYPCQTFLESFMKSNGAFVRGALISL